MTNRHKKIVDALNICMPETAEDSNRECVECPYFNTCSEDETVSVPAALMIDIREYFSTHKLDSRYLQ